MSKSELEALADRVEREKPSRELDAAIDLDLGFCPHTNTTYEAVQGDSGRTCDDCGADSWGNRNAMGRRLHDPVPAYTTSLDSAVSLTDWCIAHLSEIGGDGLPMCVLTDGTREATGFCLNSPLSGATALARALAAAALRARAAIEQEKL